MTNSFVHEKRGAMTEIRVAKIFAAANGKCHICARKLRPGDGYEIDHIIALSRGGTDDDSNLAPCCDWCHGIKTKVDTSDAAKGKRMAAKAFVPKRFKKSKGWGR